MSDEAGPGHGLPLRVPIGQGDSRLCQTVGRPSRSPSRRLAAQLHGSSRTGRLLQEQNSAGHRLQPSLAHAAWPIAWHDGARHRNRHHSRARVAPRRSGSASAAREQARPRCRPGPYRVLLSIARASVGAEPLVRTRRMSTDRSSPRTVYWDTFRSRTISLIVLPLIKCSCRIRPTVSTVSIPPPPASNQSKQCNKPTFRG